MLHRSTHPAPPSPAETLPPAVERLAASVDALFPGIRVGTIGDSEPAMTPGDTIRANAAAALRSPDPFARSLARLRAAVDHPRAPRSGSLVEVNSGDLAALLFHFDRVDAELRARAGQ